MEKENTTQFLMRPKMILFQTVDGRCTNPSGIFVGSYGDSL